jgi:hypothetical protein
MNHCVLDQYDHYWLLFDALHVAIVISIQLWIKKKQTNKNLAIFIMQGFDLKFKFFLYNDMAIEVLNVL